MSFKPLLNAYFNVLQPGIVKERHLCKKKTVKFQTLSVTALNPLPPLVADNLLEYV